MKLVERLAALVVASILLAACESRAEKLEASYAVASESAITADEVCRAAEASRDAWREDGDTDRYMIADARAYSDCARAERGVR